MMRNFLMIRDVPEFSIDPAIIETSDEIIIDILRNRAADALSVIRQVVAATGRQPTKSVFVLLSALNDPRAADDLDGVMESAPDGIILTDAKSGADVQRLGARLAVCEARYGIEDGKTRIMAVTGVAAASFFRMGSFAGSSRRLSGLIWSPEGVVTQLGANGTPAPGATERFADPVRLGRTLTLLAAADAGVPAFDATPLGIKERDLFIKARTRAQQDGFAGTVSDDPALFAKAAGS